MSYKDKIERIEKARKTDEIPLSEALRKITGGKSWIDEDATPLQNMERGDVFLNIDGQNYTHAFEMQVSRNYPQFSYSAKKVSRFIGLDGGPRWVVLGCLDPDGGMFYTIVGSFTLQEMLESSRGGCTLMSGLYWIIRPESFVGIEKKWIGNTLEEAVKAWWADAAAPI